MFALYLIGNTPTPWHVMAGSILAYIVILVFICAPLSVVAAFLSGKFREANLKHKSMAVTFEVQLLKLAHDKGGTLTIPEVSMYTDLSLEESELALNTLVELNYINLRVSKSGAVLYDFPRVA